MCSFRVAQLNLYVASCYLILLFVENMRNQFCLTFLLLAIFFSSQARVTSFSTAGFYELKQTGREVYNMNIGWRFCKGSQTDASTVDFDDSAWELVSVPHGLELLPEEASGGVNYQGEAWYRKRFTPSKNLERKKVMIHLEGVMGKSKVWLNGKLIKEHFGGFLPVIADITQQIIVGKENLLVVCTDNSDDSMFPPGKPQSALDFSYFGGIYRDCWLVTHDKLYITDANYESETAGGGLFVHYTGVSDKLARVGTRLHIKNEHSFLHHGKASFLLKDVDGKVVSSSTEAFKLRHMEAVHLETEMQVKEPKLWTPDTPYLYVLEVTLTDESGKIIDGYQQRIGIRSIEFRGEEGLWLNGKPYEKKLIGVNRHQDFAIIGNALPNSLHWRDVKKLRDGGITIIRSAHYPQDPAFMDACDELGMFVIVATPGWQFWNKEPIFGQRIYSDIRNMVRRDRNHASVFFWEPVLNETHFPEKFAANAKRCVEEEYPYSGGHYSAIDPGSEGNDAYPVIYSHPTTVSGGQSSVSVGQTDPDKVYFTREFGDNVDDWNSHNSNSRVHRSWGELPMLMQGVHYASPNYLYTCLETLYATKRNHIGGALWHSFDHQRGYHPQPFYGGLMDAYRQPKTSYYMFMSQRPVVENKNLFAQTGPMVYIAHEMSPFSPEDVTVYSNCEEVRLTVFEGGKQHVYYRSTVEMSMPSPVILFKYAFNFMELKARSRAGKQKEVYLLAEGLENGKVVATFKRMPSRRPVKLVLRADTEGRNLKADGSDIVTLIAEVVDTEGNIKRLNNYSVRFSIEGEGIILSEMGNLEHWVKMQWGSAPVLVQATHQSGKIRVTAEIQGEGVNAIAPCSIELESLPYDMKQIYQEVPDYKINTWNGTTEIRRENSSQLQQENDLLKRKIAAYELEKVERQQEDFGEQAR